MELVEGRDLFCRDNVVYMRITQGEQQVDVIYRRIDDEFLDPLQFNPSSVLGVAGVLNAARAGNVVIANAVGNGIGVDKLVYCYVPAMINYYLGEKPLLAGRHVPLLARRREGARARPARRAGAQAGRGIRRVRHPVRPERHRAPARRRRKTIRNDPRGWIAQPVVQLSRVPTKVDDRLVPRHFDLRPFAVNDGDGVFVLPGGLTRVALPKGSLVVNSSQGGGSKDTWVLAAQRSPEAERELGQRGLAVSSPAGSPAAEHGPELTIGQQQQQQQQQGPGS